MSLFSKARLAMSYLLLIVKSIAFGFFFLIWGIFFVFLSTYIKWKAVKTFERTLREEGLPPEIAHVLRKSYDFRWRDLLRRW